MIMQTVDFMGIALLPDSLLSPVSIEELEMVEAQLEFTFPKAYRDFVVKLGCGETAFHLRVFHPHDILESYMDETQERLSEHWFWDKSPNVLTQNQAVECVPFFDSSDGDDIIFHPSDQGRWRVQRLAPPAA